MAKNWTAYSLENRVMLKSTWEPTQLLSKLFFTAGGSVGVYP